MATPESFWLLFDRSGAFATALNCVARVGGRSSSWYAGRGYLAEWKISHRLRNGRALILGESGRDQCHCEAWRMSFDSAGTSMTDSSGQSSSWFWTFLRAYGWSFSSWRGTAELRILAHPRRSLFRCVLTKSRLSFLHSSIENNKKNVSFF